MEGPHWNKEDTDGPVLQSKSKGEDATFSRRERYEHDELLYEQHKGIVRVGVSADFSNWGVISVLPPGVSAGAGEREREKKELGSFCSRSSRGCSGQQCANRGDGAESDERARPPLRPPLCVQGNQRGLYAGVDAMRVQWRRLDAPDYLSRARGRECFVLVSLGSVVTNS